MRGPGRLLPMERKELSIRRRSRNDAGSTRVGDEVCVVAGSDVARQCRGGPDRHYDTRRRRISLGVLIMTGHPVNERERRGSSAAVSFVVAALFLLLALWSGIQGEAWALGLALVGALWVILGIRALRRGRQSH